VTASIAAQRWYVPTAVAVMALVFSFVSAALAWTTSNTEASPNAGQAVAVVSTRAALVLAVSRPVAEFSKTKEVASSLDRPSVVVPVTPPISS
jgi:hypothetical protein